MPELPRLAVGTVQADTDVQPILWGLMEGLQRDGLQIQSFLSRACFARCVETAAVTGRKPRHLDSWLMPREVCREIFVHGSSLSDLAVVEGRFNSAADDSESGGKLDTLCRWLDLPRIVVLDVARLARDGLPERPDELDGLLLDKVDDERHMSRLSAELEASWGVPVLGGLQASPRLREAIASVPRGSRLPEKLGQDLADNFVRHWRREAIYRAMQRREPLDAPSRLFQAVPADAKLTVAVAYDEAFNCYFPDVLDLLETGGARVVDFSPLADESLPPETDVVYLGCGHPERFASELSENYCIKLAIRGHLRRGGRLYGEGGGLAYLCEQIITPDGRCGRMAGVFPAIAWVHSDPTPPTPVEITLSRDNWLGNAGSRLRGYHNWNWHLEPAGPLMGIVADEDRRHDLVACRQAIGSQLHLNFAAQADSTDRFFRPNTCPTRAPDLWPALP